MSKKWILIWVIWGACGVNVLGAFPESVSFPLDRELIFVRPDTSNTHIFLPDSLIRDSLHYEYVNIRRFASRWKWSRQMYKWVFVRMKRANIDIVEAENSENRFKPYQGKIIRDIRIKVFPPFGSSIKDTIFGQDTLDFFRSVANTLHQSTPERQLRKQLTIRPGMEVHPFLLVENELLLKDLATVDDALIQLKLVESDTNQVDVEVICKDEFSWTASGSTNFTRNAEVGIDLRNFLGVGHIVHYELNYRGKDEQKWGNLVEYTIPNLFSSRFEFHARYENTHQNDLFSFQLQKPFLTSRTKWAGGALFSRVYSSSMLADRDIVKPVELFNYKLFDVWMGRSVRLPARYSFNQNIFLTTRYVGTRFKDHPEVSADSNHFYINRDTYLAAFTYMKIKYFKANLIYDFGTTEHIPSGLWGTLLSGFERNELHRLFYLGTEWCYSWFDIASGRFFSLSAALGTFMNNSHVEGGAFRMQGNYISPLKVLSRHRLRYYAMVDYTKGIKRMPEDKIYLTDKIYGFRSDTLAGTQRLTASLAATLFLPKIRYGFRTALSANLDAGLLSDRKKLFNNDIYWGIGLGVCLRNDNLVLKNINIRLTFYPKVPADFRWVDLHVSGKRESGFFNYRVTKPEVIRYE